MLLSFARFSALPSLAFMQRAFWPGPALTSTATRNWVAQQVAIWLSALRQPAQRNAAPKCHTPSLVGFLSFGSQHITTACACLFMRISRPSMIPRAKVRAAGLQFWARRAQFIQSHKGSFGVHRSNASQQGTERCGSSVSPSRPSLTFWSSGRFDICSLRPIHAGAPYLWR